MIRTCPEPKLKRRAVLTSYVPEFLNRHITPNSLKFHVKRRRSRAQGKDENSLGPVSPGTAGTCTRARGGNPSPHTQGIWTNLSRDDARQEPNPDLADSSRPARPARPSGGGLRASDAPVNLGAGTEPGVGRGPRSVGPGQGKQVRPTSPPRAGPATLPGSPQRQAPGPAAAGAAGAYERGQVPSPAPVSQCGRRRYRVEGPW